MTVSTMALNDAKLKNAKGQEKPYKLADERGLYVLVQPTGSRLWRMDYRFDGKRKTLALGKYPDVSLAAARDARDRARTRLAAEGDPSADRREHKRKRKIAAANTFEAVAREWLAKQAIAPVTLTKNTRMLESWAFPWIGTRPIGDITTAELLPVLQRIEQANKLETAQRTKQLCSGVFCYAVYTGRALTDPTTALRGALATPKVRHRASITDPKEIGPLLRALDGYQGHFVTVCALRLAPLLFVRPGELRHAEWTEFDLEAKEWRVPAPTMKMRKPHIVPLSEQAIAVLTELKPLTGEGRYVFPSSHGRGRPMSENTVLAALRRLGYSGDQMTGHGFRSMASTLLNEQGYNRDAIERQLAHTERNKVRAAYNYAEYLPERRKMMQAWADYLDTLRLGSNVVAGAFGRAA